MKSMFEGINVKSRSFVVIIAVAAAAILQGCFLAVVPLLIDYDKGPDNITAKAQMPASVEKVYATAVSIAEEPNQDMTVLKKDEDNYFIEVTDGKQTASLKATAIDSNNTEIIVTANIPEEEEKGKSEELAKSIVEEMCTELKVQCTFP
jgi:hypothetical protein